MAKILQKPPSALTKSRPTAAAGSCEFDTANPGQTGGSAPAPKNAAAKLRQAAKLANGALKPAAPEKATKRAPPKKPAKKTARTKRWPAADVTEVFRRFREVSAEPKGELEHSNPFTLLVAVVLSAQATDSGVNRATAALFKAADTPEKMLALGEEDVREHIRTIGLFRTKAKNVIALSAKLIAEFNSQVPRTRAELESLPGTGRKTANVVLNMAFGEHTMAVDTHVFRVGNRTGMAPGTNVLDVEHELVRIIPDEFMMHAHHWLILHGRYTCIARKPLCERCVINDLCRWPEKTVM